MLGARRHGLLQLPMEVFKFSGYDHDASNLGTAPAERGHGEAQSFEVLLMSWNDTIDHQLHGPNGPWAHMAGPWAQTGRVPKWALGPNRLWAQTGPGPKRALGPIGPWAQMSFVWPHLVLV